MRSPTSFFLIAGFSVLLTVTLTVGCSSESSGPTIPSQDNLGLTGSSSPERDTSGDAPAMILPWGVFEISWAPGSENVAVQTLRAAESSWDATEFLQPSEDRRANLGVRITDGTRFLSDGLVELDVSITHPFDSPAMTVFDVMGVVIGDGSRVSDFDPQVRFAGMSDLLLLNADGYTDLCGDGPGAEGAFTATINGYKYFADGILPDQTLDEYFTGSSIAQNRGAFLPGSTIIRNYQLRFPTEGGMPEVRFQFAVVARWQRALDSVGEPVQEPRPADFPLQANAPEPFIIRCDTSESTVYYVSESERGGELVLDMSIWDWQAPLSFGDVTQQISRIVVESPSGLIPGGPVEFGPGDIRSAVKPCCTGEFSTRLQLVIRGCEPSGLLDHILVSVEGNPSDDRSETTHSYTRSLVRVSNQYVAPLSEEINLIVVLDGAPANLYTSVRESGDAAFPQMRTIADQIKDIYRNNRGFETSPMVQSQIAPLVSQLSTLREDRASYIGSLLHSALDDIQDEVAQRIEAIDDTSVLHRDVVLNSLSVMTTREHIQEIENLSGVVEVIEDPEGAPLSFYSAQSLKLRAGTYPNVLWDNGYTGLGIDNLGCDTGIQSDHPGFVGLDIEAEAFPIGAPGCGPEDTHSHGTRVAGVQASQHATWTGMAHGIETYYSGRICSGYGWSNTVMEAYDWAGIGGTGYSDAEVLNLSYTFGCGTANGLSFCAAFADNTTDLYGCVWAIACGNRGQGCPGNDIRDDPQVCYNGVSVAGLRTNDTGTRDDDYYYTVSKYGPVYGPFSTEERLKPEIAVPTYATTTMLGGGYASLSGTSGAAPHYAGSASVLLQAGVPSSLEMRALTYATAEDFTLAPSSVGVDYYTGFGYLDNWEAYSHIADTYTGTLEATDDLHLYRIMDVQAGDRIVLVYNKHGGYYDEWQISNLDLIVTDMSNDQVLYQTTKVYENKEWIDIQAADAGKDVIVTVYATALHAGLTYEDYAISANTELLMMDAPEFSITLDAPSTAYQYDVLELNIDVQNIGGVVAEACTASVALTEGLQILFGDNPQDLGDIEPDETASARFILFAADPGSQALTAYIEGTSLGRLIEASDGNSIEVSASTLFTHPGSVERGDTLIAEASYTNHSTRTYEGLAFTINFDPDRLEIKTGPNPAHKGDISPGNSANQNWELWALLSGVTELSLGVEFTYDGHNVSFTTPPTTLNIQEPFVHPLAPLLMGPPNFTVYQLGDNLFFAWVKSAGTDPVGYFIDAWVDGVHSPLVPVGGLFLGDTTSLFLPAEFCELEAQDGDWQWSIAAVFMGGEKHWSERRLILKHVTPDLIQPEDDVEVHVNEAYEWTEEPGAVNYVAKLTGFIPGGAPYYMPLNNPLSRFQLTHEYYILLEPGVNYTWAIAGTGALGPLITPDNQARLAKLEYSEPRNFHRE